MKNKSRYIFLIAGIIILVVLFRSFGIEKFLEHLNKLGWKFWIVVSLFLFNNIILTYAWKILINYPVKKNHFFKLLLARIAGDSTSSINAIGAMAGEPIKALFLKDIIPFNNGLASVVLDRTVHTVSNILLVLTGLIFSFFILNLPLYVSVISFIIVIFILYLMLMIIKKQRDGFIEYIAGFLPAKMKNSLLTPERIIRIKELDSEISIILSSKNNLKKFYKSLIIRYASVLTTGTLEIYLITKFIGTDITLTNSMFVYIFTLFLTSLIFFMPANIGTSEGSFSIALNFLGYDPAIGLSLGIIRRIRTFIWSAIGIIILFYAGLLKKGDKDV